MTEIYRAEQLPVLQNKTYATRAEALECPSADVILVQDSSSGLVFNRAFQPELVRYDASYQNEQALSSAFQRHLEAVLEIFRQHFSDAELLEIGCGKAYFLQLLQAEGWTARGLDPTYEGNNPDVVREFYEPDMKLKANGIVLRHVLEHVANPVQLLQNLAISNGNTGRIYIEVPCLEWIAEHRASFDIFYEHVNYFRLSDLRAMFHDVVASGHLFGGQYLYIVAELSSIRQPRLSDSGAFAFPSDFKTSLDHLKQTIVQSRDRTCAIWGSASKGVILSLTLQRAGAQNLILVDINPAKQGRYLPLTGFQVHSPEQLRQKLAPGSDIYVLNPNYLGEVRELTQGAYTYIGV